MSRFALSRRAQSVLTDIYEHSLASFGPNQADDYLDSLFALFEALPDRPELWRAIPAEFGVSGYFARHQSHYVYWRELADGRMGIVTLLHVSMMQGDRLKTAFDKAD